jgi:hypothetical protein
MILMCCGLQIMDLGHEGKGADMARDVVAEIRRATRRKFRAEEKIGFSWRDRGERFPCLRHVDVRVV